MNKDITYGRIGGLEEDYTINRHERGGNRLVFCGSEFVKDDDIPNLFKRPDVFTTELDQVIKCDQDDIIAYRTHATSSGRVSLKLREINICKDGFINPLDIVLDKSQKEILDDTTHIALAIYEAIKGGLVTTEESKLIEISVTDVFHPFLSSLRASESTYDFANNPTMADVLDRVVYHDNSFGNDSDLDDLKEARRDFESKYPGMLAVKTTLENEDNIELTAYVQTYYQDEGYFDTAALTFMVNRIKLDHLKNKQTWVYITDAEEHCCEECIHINTLLLDTVKKYNACSSFHFNMMKDNSMSKIFIKKSDLFQFLNGRAAMLIKSMDAFTKYSGFDIPDSLFVEVKSGKSKECIMVDFSEAGRNMCLVYT